MLGGVTETEALQSTERGPAQPRRSLLDIVQLSLQGKLIISRLLLLLTLDKTQSKREEVETAFRPWQVTNDDEDHVTGFTIFIEEFALLLLEGPTSTVIRALDRLAFLRGPQSDALPTIQVLHFTELHGYRLMPYHITAHADALNAKSEDEGDDDAAVTDDTILEHVFRIYQGLIQISHRFPADNFSVQNGPDAYMQADEIRRLLPPLSSLRLLTQSAVARNNTWTDTEFHKFFSGKFDLRLDSEPLP